jgi:hypothetical protein
LRVFVRPFCVVKKASKLREFSPADVSRIP